NAGHWLFLPPLVAVENALADRRGAGRVLDVMPLRPALLHVGERGGFLARIGKSKPGKPAVGRHDQRLAEGGGLKAEIHGQAFAARFPFAGDMASWVTNKSCRRPGPDRPTS